MIHECGDGAFAVARRLQDNRTHRIGHPLHDDTHLDALGDHLRVSVVNGGPSVTFPPAVLM